MRDLRSRSQSAPSYQISIDRKQGDLIVRLLSPCYKTLSSYGEARGGSFWDGGLNRSHKKEEIGLSRTTCRQTFISCIPKVSRQSKSVLQSIRSTMRRQRFFSEMSTIALLGDAANSTLHSL